MPSNSADRYAHERRIREREEAARVGAGIRADAAQVRAELRRLVDEIQAEGRAAVSRLSKYGDLGDPEEVTVLSNRSRVFRSQGPKREQKATWKVLSVELPEKDWSTTAWFRLDSDGVVREPTGYALTEAWLNEYETPALERYRRESRSPEVLRRVLEALQQLGL